jgi:hypothetical protein
LLFDNISNKKTSRFILLSSLTICPFFHVYLIAFGEPIQEGLIEEYLTLLFFISSLILILTIIRVSKIREVFIHPKKTIAILVIMATLLMLVFGEEISWGQRIFEWESVGVFNNYNFQKETNVHNFFNPLYKFIYPVVGVSFFSMLIILWFFPNYKSQILDIFIPPPSFIYLTFLLGATSFRGHSEMFEEFLAIFCLLYSIRLFICLRMREGKLIYRF